MIANQLLRIARKRYGKNAWVEHNPKALKRGAKEELNQQAKALTARNKEIDEEVKKLGWKPKQLMEAARFVVDVNGDSPSIHELAAALLLADCHHALLDEKTANKEEAERLRSRGYSDTWRVGVLKNVGGFAFNEIVAHGDTAEECADKIRNRGESSASFVATES